MIEVSSSTLGKKMGIDEEPKPKLPWPVKTCLVRTLYHVLSLVTTTLSMGARCLTITHFILPRARASHGHAIMLTSNNMIAL